MGACQTYQDRLLDFLYGLLDPPEADELRGHLAVCPSCQAALGEAEGQQGLFAKAAHVLREVPLFSAPGVEVEPALRAECEKPSYEIPTPATLPLPSLKPRRSALRRYWVGWAAAAAILVTALVGNEHYQAGLKEHRRTVAERKKEVEAFNGKYAMLKSQVEKERAISAERNQAQLPQVQVVGPQKLHQDAGANFQLVTRDPEGELQNAQVNVQLYDGITNKKLLDQNVFCSGVANVHVPGMTCDNARLVVEAKTPGAQARVEEILHKSATTHATHLALNKAVYLTGEVLFFRSLTLERFSLKPPENPLPLSFELVDSAGRVARTVHAPTGPGGISGGQLALTNDLAGGPYTLQVRAAEGMPVSLTPQSKTVDIVNDEVPQIELDRAQYRAGDKVEGFFRGGRRAMGVELSNQPVTINLNADGRPVQPAPGMPNDAVQLRLDDEGNALFNFRLPQRINKEVEIVIQVHDGLKNPRLVQTIPVVPAEKIIDFFPEGGDLVAGVPNKVYYRVRTPQGDPVDPDGHVILLSSKDVLFDSPRNQGQGSFTFTPDEAEAYAVRITDTDVVQEIENPFQDLGLRTQGVVLHLPNAVTGAAEPLTAVLRCQGPPRKVLLVATCRGQIVDQQLLDVAGPMREVSLSLLPHVTGVVRLTAYDPSPGHLVPIAERLAFRLPKERLDLACRLENGQGPFVAGQKLRMRVETNSPAWMLAAVVDERYRGERTERGPLHHFLLGEEFGEQPELSHLSLEDAPHNRETLDLFLGTNGWRRFVREDAPVALAKNETRGQADVPAPVATKGLREKAQTAGIGRDNGMKAVPPGAQMGLTAAVGPRASEGRGKGDPRTVTIPVIFNKQSAPLATLRDQYQTNLDKEIRELIEKARQDRSDLMDERGLSYAELGMAQTALAEYEFLPRGYLRLGLGILILSLLAAGGVFLAIGLVRMLRKSENPPTGAFAGAFSCLFACVVLYFVAGRTVIRDNIEDAPRPAEPMRIAAVPAWPDFVAPVADNKAAQAKTPPADETATLGYLVAMDDLNRDADVQKKDLKQETAQAGKKGDAGDKNIEPPTARISQNPMAQNFAYGQFGGNFGQNSVYPGGQFQGGGQLQGGQFGQLGSGQAPGGIQNLTQGQDRSANFYTGNTELQSRFMALSQQKPKAKGPPAPTTVIQPVETPSLENPDLKKVAGEVQGTWSYQFPPNYTHQSRRQKNDNQDTLLWAPALFTENGQAQVTFDLSQNLANYRILLYANTPSGRLGFFQGNFEVRPAEAK
ncbi:MAG: zf-HC2 domain-containing protein [Gemmataceae bacterium]|nr:zf-HC2 domain-containing protein [Gemmataceae bacterium]